MPVQLRLGVHLKSSVVWFESIREYRAKVLSELRNLVLGGRLEIFMLIAQLVEHDSYKIAVMGSIPI